MKVYQVVSYHDGALHSRSRLYSSLGQARAQRTRLQRRDEKWNGRSWCEVQHGMSINPDWTPIVLGIRAAEIEWEGVE